MAYTRLASPRRTSDNARLRSVFQRRLGLEPLEERTLLSASPLGDLPAKAPADWTFMVYLDGDNNLEGAAIEDFIEMASVGSNGDVNIVVQLDRTSSYDTTYGDWTGTRRGLISFNDTPTASWGTDLGEINMGDGATLSNFVSWAMTNYAASNYALVLWDHGGGISGVCWDDTNAGDYLTNKEVSTAVAGASDTIDLLGYDACLMGMVECVYEVANMVSTVVASEQTVPWYGWSYDTVLNGLATIPSWNASQLGSYVVSRYAAYYGNTETMAAIDANVVNGSFATAMNGLATTIMQNAKLSDYAKLQVHRSDAAYYSDSTHRDLGTFLSLVAADATITTSIRTAAQTALTAYNSAVIANHSGAGENATGLSIYFSTPGDFADSSYNSTNYRWVANTQWDEFLAWWRTGPTAATTVPTVTDANIQLTGGSGIGGAFTAGDTVTATWNNTITGDNNDFITGVTVNFSQFGGGTVAASNKSGIWTAKYVIPTGTTDAVNRNVSVTATNAIGSATTWDTTSAILDNQLPVATDAHISVIGAGSGPGGTYRIGDVITVQWNNTAVGDNNADALASTGAVTVDFSQFGGDSPIEATNSGGIWTANYTITGWGSGSATRHVAVTVADNAGNTTTVADTTDLVMDLTATLTTVTAALTTDPSTAITQWTYGQTVVITATVAPFPGVATPVGSVDIVIDGNYYNTYALVNGMASFTTSVFAAGTRTVNVVYTPDPAVAFETSQCTSSFVVDKAALMIKADNTERTYGQGNPQLTCSYIGFVNGDTQNTPGVMISLPLLATSANIMSGVGTYTIYVSGGSATNYKITYKSGTLKITPATLTARADNKTMVYGSGELPTLTATFTGLVNNDTVGSVVLSAPTMSTTAFASSHVGTYTISIGGAVVASNYTVQFVSGTLKITPVPLRITAGNATMVYGGQLPVFTWSATGWVNGDTNAMVVTTPTFNPPGGVLHVGSYNVLPSGAVLMHPNDYIVTYVTGGLTVTPATLSLKANDLTLVYGTTLSSAALTYSTIGLVNGDTIDNLYDPTNYFFGPNNTSNVPDIPYPMVSLTIDLANYTGEIGIYRDVINFGNDAEATHADWSSPGNMLLEPNNPYSAWIFINNAPTVPPIPGERLHQMLNANGCFDYNITYQKGSITVVPATLNVNVDNQLMVYGGTAPYLSYTYSGLLGSDTLESITGGPSLASFIRTTTNDGTPIVIDSTTHTGTYTIGVPFTSHNKNYVVNFKSATLTVSPATVVITPLYQKIEYGGKLDQSMYTVGGTYAGGFVNGENFITPPILKASSYAPGTNVIFVSGATASPDYAIQCATGVLVVKGLKYISAQDQQIAYGGVLDQTKIDWGGVDPASVTTLPTLYTDPGVTLHAGTTYVIHVTPGTSDDYTLIGVEGTLTVTQKRLDVVALDQSMSYGGTMPPLVIDYKGLVNNDTEDSIFVSKPTIDTLAQPNSPVNSSYSIDFTSFGTLTTQAAIDYDVYWTEGTFTVERAVLTVTSDSQTKIYGSTVVLTGSIAGLLNGDNITATFSSAGTAATAAATATMAGIPYAITTTLVDPDGKLANYTVTIINGTVTVDRAALTVISDSKTKSYGSTVTLTGSVLGIRNNDNITATYASAGTAATATVAGSPYVITATLSDPNSKLSNYVVVYDNGTVTVNTAAITVTSDNKTKTYGGTVVLTGSIVGIQNGDNITATYASAGAAATATVAGSPYAITTTLVDPDGKLANYTVTYNNGTVTVNPATLTVNLDKSAYEKDYSAALPSWTYTITGYVNGENQSVLTASPIVKTDATKDSHVRASNYSVWTEGGAASNYVFDYVTHGTATLLVKSVAVTFTADSFSRTYGSANLPLTYKAKTIVNGTVVNDLVNGDTLSSIFTTQPVFETSATVASSVGKYDIYRKSYGVLTTQAQLDYYPVDYKNGQLSVTPAKLTVSSLNRTKTYGETITLTGSLGGIQNNDNITATFTSDGTAASASAAGSPYVIIVKYADPDNKLGNYTLDTTGVGKVTVNKAALTIKADDKMKIQGYENPTFTATYTGFVNGDTAASLTTQPTFSTTATIDSPSGTYVINVGGAASTNYDITPSSYTSGTLTVMPSKKVVFLGSDGVDPTVQSLYILASVWDDVIVVSAASGAGNVSVTMNNSSWGNYHVTGRIIIRGYTGNDNISVASGVTLPAWIYGDIGNDVLLGGGGANILFGGNQHDTLRGGTGRNLLLGGYGNDSLTGGSGETMMIGGITNLGANDVALTAVMKEWTSSASYATRVAHITGTPGGLNGSYFLNAATVGNDSNMKDTLIGNSAAMDLFFQSMNDVISGKKSDETLIQI